MLKWYFCFKFNILCWCEHIIIQLKKIKYEQKIYLIKKNSTFFLIISLLYQIFSFTIQLYRDTKYPQHQYGISLIMLILDVTLNHFLDLVFSFLSYVIYILATTFDLYINVSFTRLAEYLQPRLFFIILCIEYRS